MPRLVPRPSREIERILIKNGFSRVRQRGSHRTFRNADGRTVTVPVHRSVAVGTQMSIIRQSGLPRDLFTV